MPLTAYRTDAEAIERANDSKFGLGGSVWTSDAAAGSALANQLLAGTVWVNQHTNLTGAPFGGYKTSGLGRELGKADVTTFTESRKRATPRALTALCRLCRRSRAPLRIVSRAASVRHLICVLWGAETLSLAK